MKKRNYISLTIIVIAVVTAIIFCVHQEKIRDAAGEQEEIAYELPIVIPMTGELSYLAESAEWAANYAKDEINEAGGINGIPIRLSFYDSEFNENQLKNIEKKIVENYRFFIGPVDAPGTAAGLEIVKESKTPNIASYSYELIRDEAAPYGISYMSDSTEGEESAIRNWKKLNPDIEKVVIIINKGDSSQLETADILQEKLSGSDMDVMDTVMIDLSENNGLNAVVETLNAKADGYIILARSEEYGKIVSELRKRGITEGRRFTASFAAYETDMVKKQAENLEDTYIWNKFDSQYAGEAWQRLLAAYKRDHKGNGPGSSVVSDLYDAVYAWKSCMEELQLGPEINDIQAEKQEIAEWFYNSPVQHGIQGDFQWVEGKKISPIYYFQINGKGELQGISGQQGS